MPHLERVQPVDNQQIFTLSLKWCRNLISKTNISTMPPPFCATAPFRLSVASRSSKSYRSGIISSLSVQQGVELLI